MDKNLKILDVLEELESTIQNKVNAAFGVLAQEFKETLENSFKSCLFLSKDVLRLVEDEISNAKCLTKECTEKQSIENNIIPMVVINTNEPLKEEVICDQDNSYSDKYQEYSYEIDNCLEQNLNTNKDDKIRIGVMDIKDDCSLIRKDIDDYCLKLEKYSEWLNNNESRITSNKTLLVKHGKSRGRPKKERTNNETIKKDDKKKRKRKFQNRIEEDETSKELNLTKPKGRTTQEEIQLCLLCNKKTKSMRIHLGTTHRLPMKDSKRRFLLSFYRTKKVNIPVYQCNCCLLRFTNRRRDHIGHPTTEIKDKTDIEEFPDSVKEIMARNTVTQTKN